MPKTLFDRSAAEYLPDHLSLSSLKAASKCCEGCELYKRATQTVFGEGGVGARLFLIGEQPGDQEDKAGKPFVGPAGRILDNALEECGVSRREIYVTNAVKHFKWTPYGMSGKKRLHAKPSAREVSACRPWFEAELAVVKPHVIVALGATAAQALMGASFRVTRERGRLLPTQWGPQLVATVHPSSILRAPDEKARHEAYAAFVRDLRVACSAGFQPANVKRL